MPQKSPVKFTDLISKVSTIEDIRLIFNQAESRNKSLNEVANSLYQRTLTFLTISLTALTSLVVYISQVEPDFTPKYVCSIVLVLLLVAVCNILRKVIVMKEYFGIGAYPSDLVNEDFYKNIELGKCPEWYILERLIKDYQERLETNHELNIERANYIKSAINWLFFTPGIIALIYVLFLFFS